MDKETIIVSFIFLVHLTLISWSHVGFPFGMPHIFFNLFFLESLLLSAYNPQSLTMLFVSALLDGLGIFLDIILIGIAFTYRHYGVLFVLSTITAFLNLVFRLPSLFILLKIHSEKRQNDQQPNDNMENVVNTIRGYFVFQHRSPQTTPSPNAS